ncbi:MAG: hypothetical protein NXY57DRAFT_179130 [Lentinula lateritia]|nr:MAG: hypothetical protein NXY57DRAFT_179130 [Lentinula lateritia]
MGLLCLYYHLYRPFHGTHDGKLCFSMLLPAPGSSTILYPSQWKVAGRLAFKINCIHVLLSLLCFSTFSSGMSLTACITVSPHIHGMRYGVRACMVLIERALSTVVGKFNYRVPGRTRQGAINVSQIPLVSGHIRLHPSTVSVGCLDTSVHPYALILVLGVDRWGITNLFYYCFLGGGVAATLLSAISSGTRILTGQ